MSKRRVTAAEKKKKGTFNVTRDKDTDFEIVSGLVTMVPRCPADFNETEKEIWQRYWRHLVKHNYGKESDKELMELTVREWTKYNHFRTFDQGQAHKALDKFMKGLEMLGISPTAMAKVAILTKGKKKEAGIGGELKKAASE